MLRLAVLISGRGSNLQAIIDHITAGSLQAEISVVISNEEAAMGLERARKNGISTRCISLKDFPDRQAYDRALAGLVGEYQVDLVVLAGYMLVLGPDFLDSFPLKVINIHPALLPSFPGVHAQKQALDYGVKVSGCTVHFVDGGTDTGPVIAQRVVTVYDDDSEETLAERILAEEHSLYSQVIQWIAEGRVLVSGHKVWVGEKVRA